MPAASPRAPVTRRVLAALCIPDGAPLCISVRAAVVTIIAYRAGRRR
jgi:hypothetical protein